MPITKNAIIRYQALDNYFIPPELVSAHCLKNGNKVLGEIEEYIDKDSGALRTRVKSIKKT